MKKLSAFLFAVLVVLMVPALVQAAKKMGPHTYKAYLSGKMEVPKTESMGKGWATFEPFKNGKELKYKVIVEGLENVTAAHIHFGKKGVEGPPVVGLFAGPEKKGKFDGMLAEGTITKTDLIGPMAGKTVEDLIKAIHKGEVYVNVHTEKYAEGELRGQIQ